MCTTCVCVRVCVCASQSIKGQAVVLAGWGWNVTRLTAACCGTQIPQTSPAKGPFLSCPQTHTQRYTSYNTHCCKITPKQSGTCGESSVRTVLRLIVWLLWRAISSGRRKRACVRVCEGSVCFFNTRGSVTWGVREFSIKIWLCNCRAVRVCVFIHVCTLSA